MSLMTTCVRLILTNFVFISTTVILPVQWDRVSNRNCRNHLCKNYWWKRIIMETPIPKKHATGHEVLFKQRSNNEYIRVNQNQNSGGW
jgi:hypothetical protein